MSNNDTRFAAVRRKSHVKPGWLNLLTFGVVILIFALVAYQTGHGVASTIRASAKVVVDPTSLPIEVQPTTDLAPTKPTLPPIVPVEVALPPSNKPSVGKNPTPALTKSAAPQPTAKPVAPVAMAKPAVPPASIPKPKPTTKPS